MIKADKLALFNEQLAGMLKAGIPLEGALRRTVKDMRSRKFAKEVVLLEEDLAKGTPFADAISERQFPDFYKKMVIAGAKTDRLPEALTSVADYYRRRSEIGIRLSGLMLYPVLVLTASLILSLFTTFYFHTELKNIMSEMYSDLFYKKAPLFFLSQFAGFIVFAVLFLIMFFISICKRLRRYLSWKFAPFRDVNIANFAHMISICLKSGMTLHDALTFAAAFEKGKIKDQLDMMISNIEDGMSLDGALRLCTFLPGTAQWLIVNAADKPEDGFDSVAEIFNKRAIYRTDVLLYVALPLSVCFVAAIITLQLAGCVKAVMQVIGWLGGGCY